MAVTKSACRSRSLCFTCSLLFILLHQIVAKKELKFAVVVFRHGDRTPIENFPTDLHKESEWPQGFGQLTKTGMRQQHELGQYTRKRYSKFLSATYNRKQVYIQSTDYDRTLMSAQTYLAGLFPPTGNQIWNPRILWQPIPVHTRPRSAEKMLHFPIPNCPRYDELQNETQASSELQNRMQPYLDFLQTVAVNSGYEMDILKTVGNFKIWNTYDTLLCERIHNYTVPEWATKDFTDKMERLTELSLLSLFGIYKTEEKSRLQGGVLVNDILKNIKKAANPSNKRKLRIYSAHDTTIGALQVALNIFNGKLPPYSACQFFELYQESSGQYSIEMYYRNDTSKDPYLITLPGCTPACPLEKFTELVSPVLVEDWSKACGNKDIMRVWKVQA
ncbi:PREDICTED: prostatic acid phosphatase-like isoform X2 [Gavialis gangeticus]|uniref:prostatic acid phosphatase-like isoform X2 n=1 Tax=Gavialis gangeticus TaxID=94835 RepID=UPI00092E95BB|nr:PREDICTED: prostatic acid phosphatase-like isoform X2 [Gavialis gangeticus]